MTKRRITKSKKLGPDQLQIGEMYFATNGGFSLFRTEREANPEVSKVADLVETVALSAVSSMFVGIPKVNLNTQTWRQVQTKVQTIGWKQPFLVVAITRLHKAQHGGLRKFLVKIIAGEKMGWFCAQEIRKTFKKLEPNALQEDNSEYKPAPAYLGPTSWFLLPQTSP